MDFSSKNGEDSRNNFFKKLHSTYFHDIPNTDEIQAIEEYKAYIIAAIKNIYGPLYKFGLKEANIDLSGNSDAHPIKEFIDNNGTYFTLDLPYSETSTTDPINLSKALHILDQTAEYTEEEKEFYSCFTKLPSVYVLKELKLEGKTENLESLLWRFNKSAASLMLTLHHKLHAYLDTQVYKQRYNKTRVRGLLSVTSRVKKPGSLVFNRIFEQKPIFCSPDLFGLRVIPEKEEDIAPLEKLITKHKDSPFIQIPGMSHVWDPNDPSVDIDKGIRNTRDSGLMYTSLDFFVTQKSYLNESGFNPEIQYPINIDVQLRTEKEQLNIEGSEANSRLYKYRQLMKFLLLCMSDRNYLNEKMFIAKVHIESLKNFNNKINQKYARLSKFENYLKILQETEREVWAKYNLEFPEIQDPVTLALKKLERSHERGNGELH